MRVGFTAAYTYAFKGTAMGLDDYLDSIKTIGSVNVRYFDLEILEEKHIAIYSTPENILKLKQACAESGVNIVGFTAWVCVKYLHSLDPALHEKCYELFSSTCRIASEFNCEYVHLGSDMIGEFIVERDPTYASAPAIKIAVSENVDFRRVYQDYALRLRKLAGIAADHGLKLSLEARANAMVTGADSFLELYRHAGHDNLYCCLDVIHSCFHRENIPIAIEKLADKLLVFQLCDCRPGELVHYPLKEGKVDLESILYTLRKIDFKGNLMLEIYRGGDDDKATVDEQYRQALNMIKQVI